MKRIEQCFNSLKQQRKKALIPFITTGDPQNVATVDILHALVAGGANIIELGVPFSDPAADGEAIQHASERALNNNINYNDVLAAVKAFRQTNQSTPILLMGYLNPVITYPQGFAGFYEAAQQAGVDATIIVDLSYESGKNERQILRDNNIDLINLVSPTTSTVRLKKMTTRATGFLYYVSMRGVTGAGTGLDTAEIEKAVAKIRAVSELPVCIGFGISDAESAQTVANLADGIVVGSALVKKLYNACQQDKDVIATAKEFMQELRTAID